MFLSQLQTFRNLRNFWVPEKLAESNFAKSELTAYMYGTYVYKRQSNGDSNPSTLEFKPMQNDRADAYVFTPYVSFRHLGPLRFHFHKKK